MRWKFLLLLIVSFINGTFSVWAEEPSSIQDAKAICSTFLEYIVSSDLKSAFSYLRSKPNLLAEENIAKLEETAIQQSDAIKQLYGNAIDYKLVEERIVADSILRLVYVIRRESHIIRWKFIYYKPRDTWKLDAISFDDKIEQLF